MEKGEPTLGGVWQEPVTLDLRVPSSETVRQTKEIPHEPLSCIGQRLFLGR